jgi:hypothetical protein
MEMEFLRHQDILTLQGTQELKDFVLPMQLRKHPDTRYRQLGAGLPAAIEEGVYELGVHRQRH